MILIPIPRPSARQLCFTPASLRSRGKHSTDRKAKRSHAPAAKPSLLTLSNKELARVEIVALLDKRVITVTEAQILLKVQRGQTYRLWSKYRLHGPSGLISKARGVTGNRAFPLKLKARVLELIREQYHDYGPNLIAEILFERHAIKLSNETVRSWMIAAGLWITNRAKRRQLHQPRKRMTHYGDLVQMDGSDHDWFEGRGPRCTAMVMVDDATGKLQALRFFPRENRDAYFQTAHSYVADHGRPARIQTDRHAAIWSRDQRTDFTIALQDRLRIIHSIAYSPESKGRVERINRTLQDRLVKAFRREGVSTIESANEYAATFMRAFNSRFGREPRAPENSHRTVHPDDLASALSMREERRVTKQLTFSFRRHEYIIEGAIEDRPWIGRRVTVEIRLDGTMIVFADGRQLTVRRVLS